MNATGTPDNRALGGLDGPEHDRADRDIERRNQLVGRVAQLENAPRDRWDWC